MKIKIVIISGLVGLAMVAVLVVGIASAANIRQGNEVDLTPDGYVYELNPDPQGNLWLSEFHANQVWQINPATNVYTIFG